MNFPGLRSFALVFLTLLVVPFASAETIRFDPPNATVNHSVDAIVSGVWPNGCVPTVKSVVAAASTVTLHLNADSSSGVCTQVLSSYVRTFHLNVLPAGSYTVILVADQGATPTELARAPLIVRDAETLSISPYAVPASGGPVSIVNPYFLAPVGVTINGVEVPANSEIDGSLLVMAPPHAPGAVDVAIRAFVCTLGCPTTTAKAGLIYYDPASADPAVFEPILFPLAFQGPGAFGSQWTTESFISASGSLAFFRDPLPCTGCSSMFSIGTSQLLNNGNPWGHVLYAMRGTSGNLDLASRIRDSSRQALTAGTEVRVARERDFRSRLRFMNIPVDARYRVTLRLWSLGGGSPFVATVDSIPAQQVPLSMMQIPGTPMSFASADITSLIARGIGNPTNLTVAQSIFESIGTPPAQIWGIVSITNNDTQQVTIVTPQ
ncbi:MAG: hypothetical protein QOK37_1971 [Thermoanaerobaculia bacterium]|jgi:hypothetical protein|nr:hypothetical protein [Thermoanaerobaculia bacterium]